MRFTHPRTPLLLVGSVIVALLLLALIVDWATWPPGPLTREQAEEDAFVHLQSFCDHYNYDISRFGRPKVFRGTCEHYEEKAGSLYGVDSPTWDFYYTYRGKPAITVYISYDEMNRSTELMSVLQPGEKWP